MMVNNLDLLTAYVQREKGGEYQALKYAIKLGPRGLKFAWNKIKMLSKLSW